MQKLKEYILKHRSYNITNFQNESRNSEGYEARIFLCDDLLDSIESYLLDQEKEMIQEAFLDGCHSVPDDGFPISAKDYYNEKFNKEK